MLKIKHKELSRLLGVSASYSKLLLHRKKLKLTNEYVDEVIEIIVQRRIKNEKR